MRASRMQILETNRYLLEHGQDNSVETAARFPTAMIRPPVFVHPSARVGRVCGRPACCDWRWMYHPTQS